MPVDWLPWVGRKVRSLERVVLSEIAPMRWQAASMAAEVARRHNAAISFDRDFFTCWRLSKPLIYPQIGTGLMLLPDDVFIRAGYFHAQLAEARSRLSDGENTCGFAPSPYRLLSSLVRAVNEVQPLMRSPIGKRASAVVPALPDTTEANSCVEALELAEQEPAVIPYCWFDCVAP